MTEVKPTLRMAGGLENCTNCVTRSEKQWKIIEYPYVSIR